MDFEKEALQKVIETQQEEMEKCEVGSEAQAQTVDCIAKSVDRLIEIERLKDERIDKWVRNGVALAGVILPLAVTIWGANKSWNFERDPDGGMVTSAAGRKFMDRIFSRK